MLQVLRALVLDFELQRVCVFRWVVLRTGRGVSAGAGNAQLSLFFTRRSCTHQNSNLRDAHDAHRDDGDKNRGAVARAARRCGSARRALASFSGQSLRRPAARLRGASNGARGVRRYGGSHARARSKDRRRWRRPLRVSTDQTIQRGGGSDFGRALPAAARRRARETSAAPASRGFACFASTLGCALVQRGGAPCSYACARGTHFTRTQAHRTLPRLTRAARAQRWHREADGARRRYGW